MSEEYIYHTIGNGKKLRAKKQKNGKYMIQRRDYFIWWTPTEERAERHYIGAGLSRVTIKHVPIVLPLDEVSEFFNKIDRDYEDELL